MYTRFLTVGLNGYLDVHQQSLKFVRNNLTLQKQNWSEYEIVYFNYCFNIPPRSGIGRCLSSANDHD